MRPSVDPTALGIGRDQYQYGFSDPEAQVYKTEKGLSERVVRDISANKGEPSWMTDFRLASLNLFESKPLPRWGADLAALRFDDLYYYVKPVSEQGASWDDIPPEIKKTFDRLGIPEAEQKFLGGVGAQYDSEVVYHNIREDLKKQGVIFVDPETGVREHPDLFRKYFGTVIPPGDNKFAALNSAVWSGGSFIYIPPGVQVNVPLQAYFRINAKNMGQFERTLIIADEGSSVHYVEGCTAPIYTTDSLHSAVVEIVALKGARVRYTTIQNWSGDVFNLVTKRAKAYEGATVEWVDGNLGSKITMKYPAVFLMEPGAHGEVLSVAFAGRGQHQDTGAKMVHVAPDTTSIITSKSISKDGGRSSYRGLVKAYEGADRIKSKVVCDALILDPDSQSDTYPTIEVEESDAEIEHEARVSRISAEQLFYLRTRGLTEGEASKMIVNGFLEPFVKSLPMEYAVELNRLIDLEMEGSVG
jgi:Fe-S cluster assembly protein SufB